jgi:tetratricopeptide (TPR) repeat protein
VDAVLTGTLLRADDRVRLTAQLVEAPGGTILWSRTAEVRMGDVFQLQDDLVRQVIDSLSIPLAAGDRRRLGRDAPATGRAYELYLRANHLAHGTVAREPLVAARELYVAALEEDPGYAPAWARLGRVYRVLAKYSSGHLDEENVRLAGEAFDRAFALSPDLPVAHHLYTHFEIEQLARPEAAMIRLLGRVREMPNDPDLFAGLVVACRFRGLLEESAAAADRARHLDPGLRTSVQHTYFLLNDHEQAEALRLPGGTLADRPAARPARRGRGRAPPDAPDLRRSGQARAHVRGDARSRGRRTRGRHEAAGRGDSRHGLPRSGRAVAGRAGVVPCGPARRSPRSARAGQFDAGYTCPQLRDQPWFAPLAGDERFERLIASAEAARQRALDAFEAAGGRRLLGM